MARPARERLTRWWDSVFRAKIIMSIEGSSLGPWNSYLNASTGNEKTESILSSDAPSSKFITSRSLIFSTSPTITSNWGKTQEKVFMYRESQKRLSIEETRQWKSYTKDQSLDMLARLSTTKRAPDHILFSPCKSSRSIQKMEWAIPRSDNSISSILLVRKEPSRAQEKD